MASGEPEDGERTERTAATCAAARVSGDGKEPERREQHEDRIHVAREPSDLVARTSSISSGRPFAVLQTACTMFPRSKRPSR